MSKTTIQQFAHFDDNIYPFVIQEGTIISKVPPAYYHVGMGMSGPFLVQKSKSLNLPAKIYGSTISRSSRIWSAYDSNNAAMAAGLFGSKGAGKTLLSNVIANQAIERGLPVIDVSSSFSTDKAYLNFLNSLGECVIIFDEFLKHLSKMGDKEHESKNEMAEGRQDEMLTFFSGSNNSKRLVLLIDNSAYMLSTFFKDRPGRMRYMFNYAGVETDVVMNVAKDAGLPDTKIDTLVTYAKRYSCTFDTINEIVKEWVLFPEDTLEDITNIMNVPSIFELPSQKGRVVSFKHSEGWTLENELCEMDSQGRVVVNAQYPNELYGKNFKTKEELQEYDDDYGWDYYQKVKDQPMIQHSYTMNDRSLVALKGNMFAYKDAVAELQVELFEAVKPEPKFNLDLLY